MSEPVEAKPGWKTSEFWVTFALMLLGTFLSAGFVADDHWLVKVISLIIAGAAGLGYTVSRSVVKSKEAELKIPEWAE